MVSFVIDASAALAWLFRDAQDSGRIDTLLESADAHAPPIWRLEVANIVLVRERRKLISPDHARVYLSEIDGIGVNLTDGAAAVSASTIAHLARPHQLTAYDAAYLDLAITLGFPLCTIDRNLTEAAKRSGIPLVLSDGQSGRHGG
ncbi:MAG: type II toxin-antitoxin system VapC family toxin [Phycisphaeraceae bacterium]|nr:type II toxin-antitoxin system VapC family toxin [Phycisphaeraceae bacterium]